MINNEIKEEIIEIKELQIEKYPMAKSTHLIEYFLIIGYEESYINEKIIKNINTKIESEEKENEEKEDEEKKENIVSEFNIRHFPTIISSISSNFIEPMAEERYIIQNIFPIPPTIYYTSGNNITYEPNPINVIFTNIQNEVVNIYYSYIFYEKEYAYNKSIIFIPKAFVILSQYPYFNTFKNICKELLYSQFKNDSLEIPIEIQLYNIVNFTPSPWNSKLNLTFFPSIDLYTIAKCESDIELLNLQNQKIYNLNQLSGYRQSEIDFSVIFCVLPLDLIIQIYIQLLTKSTIAFFSKNIEILNATLYIFQQFLYPLNHEEIVHTLSPTRYFCSDLYIQNVVGFLCCFNEINNYNPFRKVKNDEFKCLSENEEKEDFDYNLFGCDFVVDLDKKSFIDVHNNINMDNYEKYKNQKNDILSFIINLFYCNQSDENTELEISIIKLINSLRKIKSKLTYSDTNKNIPNFFNNNTSFNKSIQEAFYFFNLEISYQYFQSISQYNGDYRLSKKERLKKKQSITESNLNDNDYIFLNLFSETLYCSILNNFVGGYSPDEPLLYKTPRLIFDYFLSLKKLSNDMNITNENLIKNIFDIIDNVYIDKDKIIQEKNISFLNFYKYYKNKMVLLIYNLIDNKYIDTKIERIDENTYKYYYKYKRIELDKNLIMEYIYIIEQMDKNKLSNIFNKENAESFLLYKPIEQKTSLRLIYNIIEKHFITSNYIENKDIINISILNIVALTIHQKTVFHFSLSIYALFFKLFFSIKKYIGIILSIASRLYIKDKEKNLYFYEIYFNLYKLTIEANKLFPNDELIYLKKIKDNFSSEIKNIEISEDKFKKLEGLEQDKLYSLESEKKLYEIKNIFEEGDKIIDGIIKNKIIFKSKFHKNKILIYNEIYSPIMFYNLSNHLLECYFDELDFNKVNKYQYEKILICLLLYSQIWESELPKDINRFLFYCLVYEYL